MPAQIDNWRGIWLQIEQFKFSAVAKRRNSFAEFKQLGGLDVLVTDDVAMLADRTSFAGSVATADRLVRNAYKNIGLPLCEAVNMVSLNTARHLGLDDKLGSIEIGKIADIIIFDENINVVNVIRQ
jgi:N-acetylglucosamine-6-phosphate deacetylase